jgi:hypothetical protein
VHGIEVLPNHHRSLNLCFARATARYWIERFLIHGPSTFRLSPDITLAVDRLGPRQFAAVLRNKKILYWPSAIDILMINFSCNRGERAYEMG